MLKPLTIGKLDFATNLIQAPLAGISCAPFRELVWQFGAVAYCCTEMLSSQHLASGIDRSPRYNVVSPKEGPLCWQLSGKDPDILAKASERAIALGADLLDLNCGCPQPKIRKKGCGTKLLTQEKQLASLVKAMQHDPNTPVTVKMRIDSGLGDFDEVSTAAMLEQSGVDAIIVHGRSWQDDYSIACNYESIANIVNTVSIPVIGNGDIEDPSTLNKMFTETACAGFMIARASVGQPWLFQQLTQFEFVKPNLSEIGQLFLQHASGLIALDGEFNAMMQCRKLGKYYARGLIDSQSEFLEQLYQVISYKQLENLIRAFFNEVALGSR